MYINGVNTTLKNLSDTIINSIIYIKNELLIILDILKKIYEYPYMSLIGCNFKFTRTLVLAFAVTGTGGLVTTYTLCHGIGVKLKAEILNNFWVA